jgi:hypothetical protein
MAASKPLASASWLAPVSWRSVAQGSWQTLVVVRGVPLYLGDRLLE